MTYADTNQCHGWHRIAHHADSTQVIGVPDRYAWVGAQRMIIQVQLCAVCIADYRAHPGDYQEGRRVTGGAQNEEVSDEGASWAMEGA
jgi:hypothetical protein